MYPLESKVCRGTPGGTACNAIIYNFYDTALIEWHYGPGETAVPRRAKGNV